MNIAQLICNICVCVFFLSKHPGDSFGAHDGMMFITKYRDNDQDPGNCAVNAGGSGWWFNACQTALLTGVYGEHISWEKGIYWEKPWGRNKLVKYATMMIRPTT